jgi:hypothetical protein
VTDVFCAFTWADDSSGHHARHECISLADEPHEVHECAYCGATTSLSACPSCYGAGGFVREGWAGSEIAELWSPCPACGGTGDGPVVGT